MSTDPPLPKAETPDFRIYRHRRCREETVIHGQSFEVASNPMSSMERTYCLTCGAMFPIEEFEWTDTGESISDYYARHSVNATALQRFLCSKKFMVGLIATIAVTTAAGTYQLVANEKLFGRIVVVAGGLMIGGFLGMAVFISGIANPIKRKVCGVSDTRVLR